MDIFQKIQELNPPKGSYVVVGGGVLMALGLLDWDDDVDIAVTPALYESFKAHGWQQADWRGKTVLKHDVFDVGIGFYTWNLDDLLYDALWLRGVPFMSLHKLLHWKKQVGREKDRYHIRLIEQYVASQQAKSKRPPA